MAATTRSRTTIRCTSARSGARARRRPPRRAGAPTSCSSWALGSGSSRASTTRDTSSPARPSSRWTSTAGTSAASTPWRWGSRPTRARLSRPSWTRWRKTHVRRAAETWQGEARELRARREARLLADAALDGTPIKPQRVYAELRRALPPDTIVTLDAGAAPAYGYDRLRFTRPRTFLTPLDLGCLGFAFPAALGAKLGRPDAPVLAIHGDGGFLMNAQELETAVRHGIAAVTLVMNNNGWGSEKAYQRAFYQARYVGADLGNPRFDRYAELFGARGYYVERPEAIGEVMRAALAAGRPAIVEIPIDPDELPAPATAAGRRELGRDAPGRRLSRRARPGGARRHRGRVSPEARAPHGDVGRSRRPPRPGEGRGVLRRRHLGDPGEPDGRRARTAAHPEVGHRRRQDRPRRCAGPRDPGGHHRRGQRGARRGVHAPPDARRAAAPAGGGGGVPRRRRGTGPAGTPASRPGSSGASASGSSGSARSAARWRSGSRRSTSTSATSTSGGRRRRRSRPSGCASRSSTRSWPRPTS